MPLPVLPLPRRSDPFQVAVGHVLALEGGLVDNPQDTGGRTNRGITQRTLDATRTTYPDAGLPLKVDDLTEAQATNIYLVQYWHPIRGEELPRGVSLAVFDAAVNSGVSRAAAWLQEAIGVEADGWIGLRTIAAVRALDAADVLEEFNSLRMFSYMQQDATRRKAFGRGWSRRLMRTNRIAVREI